MPRSGPGAGAEDHLVVREVGDNLVDQRQHGVASAVHDTLAADLDDIYPRQDGEIRRCLGGALQRRVAEGSAHKTFAKLCEHGIIGAPHVAYSPENLNTRSSKRCVSGNVASRPPNCVWAQTASVANAFSRCLRGSWENRAAVAWRSRNARGLRSARQIAPTRWLAEQAIAVRCRSASSRVLCRSSLVPSSAARCCLIRASTPSSGVTVRPSISAAFGRSTRRASSTSRRQSCRPPNICTSITASKTALANGSA